MVSALAIITPRTAIESSRVHLFKKRRFLFGKGVRETGVALYGFLDWKDFSPDVRFIGFVQGERVSVSGAVFLPV